MENQSNQLGLTISSVSLHALAQQKTESAMTSVKLLIEQYAHKVSEHRIDDGSTPLHLAAFCDNLAMVKLLIHMGGDIDALDSFGRTPITLAVGKSHAYLRELKQGPPNQQVKDKKKKFNFISNLLPNFGKPKDPNKKETQNKFKKFFGKGQKVVTCTENELPGEGSVIIPNFEPPPESTATTGNLDEDLAQNEKENIEKLYAPIIKSPKQLAFNPFYKESPKEMAPPKPPRRDYNCTEELKPNGTEENDVAAIEEKGPPLPYRNLKISFVSDDEGDKSTLVNDSFRSALNSPVDHMDEMSFLCNNMGSVNINEPPATIPGGKKVPVTLYSPTLNQFIMNSSDSSMYSDGVMLDGQLKDELYSDATPQKKNKLPNYFCYLLLDPTILNGVDGMIGFDKFVESVFYAGKGTNARTKAHLLETLKKRTENTPLCGKTQKISDLWDQKVGVIQLQINQSINEAEALCREAAIIEAVTLSKLTNKKKGEFYGNSAIWSAKEKQLLGCICLDRAFKMYQIENIRPIHEHDLK
uniref:ANK_REP_REGION domain-containing protein n=1 Tax=Rhabditophanes sp. KR3021 TaxID=114890 RepID=A0AC35TNG2_9BILA